MRSRFLARVVRAGLAVSVVITLGCGKPPSAPSEPPTPPPPPFDVRALSAQQRAAFALFESAGLHGSLTASALIWASEEGEVLTNGPCAFGGLMQGSLDGGVSPSAGAFLPTGSHTYVVSFNNCGAGWNGEVTLDGVASAAYNTAQWSNVTATVSADSMRCRAGCGFALLNDVTADGSGVWTYVRLSGNTTTTYTPATGSRLANNSTTNVAIFGGGSYSDNGYPVNRWERRFDNLKVAINGTEYTLNGSLERTIVGSSRPYDAYTGEVRITNSGTLVARIYGDVQKALKIEVLVPLVPS